MKLNANVICKLVEQGFPDNLNFIYICVLLFYSAS